MSKKVGIICAIVIVLAAVFCLYQFTDIFGAKQDKTVAAAAQPTAAPVETATEAPAPTEAPTEEPAPTEAPSEAPTEEPAATEAPVEAPTEEPAATEAPVEAPTEEPAATEAPVEAPTEEPVPTEAAAEEAPAETAEEPVAENPVLAIVDGKEITLADTQNVLNSLVSGGYINDSTDYKTALDYLIQTRILSDKIKELGFDQFTDEETAEFTAKGKAEWEEAIQQYVSYFGGNDETALEQTRIFWKARKWLYRKRTFRRSLTRPPNRTLLPSMATWAPTSCIRLTTASSSSSCRKATAASSTSCWTWTKR